MKFESLTIEHEDTIPQEPLELLASEVLAKILGVLNINSKEQAIKKYGLVGSTKEGRVMTLTPYKLVEEPSNIQLVQKQVDDFVKVEDLAQEIKQSIKMLLAAVEGGKILSPEDDEQVDIPFWLSEMYPDCDKTLLFRIVKQLDLKCQLNLSSDMSFNKNKRKLNDFLAGTVFNNFSFNVLMLHRIARGDHAECYYDNIMNLERILSSEEQEMFGTRTNDEFYNEVIKEIENQGLSMEELERIGNATSEGNIYLLPVAIELMKKGYNLKSLAA